MATLRTYQEALDFIYSTFMRVKDRVKGLYDRDIRTPGRIVGLAEQLDIVPDPSRTVRITLRALPYPASASAITGTAEASTISRTRARTSGRLSNPRSGTPVLRAIDGAAPGAGGPQCIDGTCYL